jgi:hypothetical protein
MSDALVLGNLVRTIAVPGLIADAGDDTSRTFLERQLLPARRLAIHTENESEP